MINRNWLRWIRAACRVHFDARKESHYLYYEGLDRDEIKNQHEWAELRVDGPHVTPQSGQSLLQVDLNVIIQSKTSNEDLDKIYRIAGVFHEAFTPTIAVFNFDEDPPVALGCLSLDGKIGFNYFGLVDKDLKLEEASIEARYIIELEG